MVNIQGIRRKYVFTEARFSRVFVVSSSPLLKGGKTQLLQSERSFWALAER